MSEKIKLAVLPEAELLLKKNGINDRPALWESISTLENAKEKGFEWVLSLDEEVLQLRSLRDKDLDRIKVDFLAGSMVYRQRHGQGKGELLAKAVGIKKKYLPSVLDVTAGLGKDSYILASLGCQVTMLERSPLIASLLQNGMARAAEDSESSPIIERMNLLNRDSIQFLNSNPPSILNYDCIYLDPMFPENKKSRLVKKEMRAFRKLLGEDFDSADLLNAAFASDIHRVVVKRHRHDKKIGGLKPALEFIGKTTRFDVYFNKL